MSPNKVNDSLQDNNAKDPGATAPVNIENQSLEHTPVTQRLRKEILLKKNQVGLRIAALLFSCISFAVMASAKNITYYFDGVIIVYNFDTYGSYRYLVAVGIISTLYFKAQVWRQFFEFRGMYVLSQRTLNFLDFFGDQIVAYLLVSAASSAIPTTDVLSQLTAYGTNTFTISAAASISMAFLAFLAAAASAGISGYMLSSQTCI
ncbi:hypothetical protein NE237_005450 [Protea cynaroides]|uniref:CASP-like protein n=1 Tax=Protea cynaroides TaxID=273540 RepID=A0A9Q0KLE0_9MAGN|nr:hypothetical protein NE237_005450 [Protea cynaroides]